MRYLPMGYFNQNSLGKITSVTTNTLEGLSDVATRVVMMTVQGFLTTGLITVLVFLYDWRVGLVSLGGSRPLFSCPIPSCVGKLARFLMTSIRRIWTW